MRTLAVLLLGAGLLLPLAASAEDGCGYASKLYAIDSTQCQGRAEYRCDGHTATVNANHWTAVPRDRDCRH
jgi:hypothetical protein